MIILMLQSYSTQNGSRIAVNASMVNAMHAFATLGRSAQRHGIVNDYDSATRQIGCFVDSHARDAAIYDWIQQWVLTKGRAVELNGLISKAELNGMSGVVAGASRQGADGGWRVPVRVATGNNAMLVRFNNLECAAP